jgi:hypothetical protein
LARRGPLYRSRWTVQNAGIVVRWCR